MNRNSNISKKRRWSIYPRKSSHLIEVKTLPDVYDLKLLLELTGINLKPRSTSIKSSKLSPSLLDILKKSVALGYFLEYLNNHGKKNMLDFWLEAETLRMVLESRYKRKPTHRGSVSSINSIGHYMPRHRSISYDCEMNYTGLLSDDKTQYETNYENNQCDCRNEMYATVSKGDSANTYSSLASSSFHEYSNPSDRFKGSTLSLQSSYSLSPTISSLEDFRQRARTRSSIIDAVTIYTRYISLDSDLQIHLPSKQRQAIEATVCNDKAFLDPTCFVDAQEFAFQQLLSSYADFLQTDNMVRYQLRFLQEKFIRLQDILYNDSIFFYFTEFLDQQGRKTLLEFHMSTENFEEDIRARLDEDCYDKEAAITDAMALYDKYFSMRCKEQLISDDKLRIVLENNICREEGPQANCFCIPMAYAWTALSEVYLPAFLTSPQYQSYIDHLRSACSEISRRTRLHSSQSSLSTEDTVSLLNRSDSKSNFFDERELGEFNVNSSHHGSRLALCHVNEYGELNSDMQPITTMQQKSSVSKLSRKMKNLLRRETQEETEQLAWERARKIISDIQKQTQSS